MLQDRLRSIRNKKEIKELSHVQKILHHYSDKRTGNKRRHKMGIIIAHNPRKNIQIIQSIIKKNYPESFPQIYRGGVGSSDREKGGPTFVEIVWFAESVMCIDKIFEVILEEKGYKLCGPIAQSRLEHLPYKREVSGSSPDRPTNLRRRK